MSKRFLVTKSGGRLRPLFSELLDIYEMREEFAEDWERGPWEEFARDAEPGDWVLVVNDGGTMRASVVCANANAWDASGTPGKTGGGS